MSIIFFRFFLLFSVVANRVGPKTRYHRACSRSLTSLVLSRSLRFAAKILYEIMLVRIFCNFSFFFTQFFWLMGWVGELFWGFLRFQLLFSALFRIFGRGWDAVWGISAVSATFSCSFQAFWLGLGCCFGDFCGFSSTRPACYATNLWLLYIMII